MKKGLNIFLIVGSIVAFTIAISIFAINKIKIHNSNTKADTIEVIDNNDIEPLEQKEISYDDTIGKLTIPDILLENAPILESIELTTLSKGIGHFTNTNLYSGNVGLASHNSGSEGDFFRNLNKVKIGSEIYYQTDFGTKKYIVKTIVKISDEDWSYLEETEDNRITLITCVKNAGDKRLCVQAIEN